jgi:hypothetical protein
VGVREASAAGRLRGTAASSGVVTGRKVCGDMSAREQEYTVLRSQRCSMCAGGYVGTRTGKHCITFTELFDLVRGRRIARKHDNTVLRSQRCSHSASARKSNSTQAQKHCITFTAALVLCRERDEIGLRDGSAFTRQTRRLLYKTVRRL